jgi:hypothetical protein
VRAVLAHFCEPRQVGRLGIAYLEAEEL